MTYATTTAAFYIERMCICIAVVLLSLPAADGKDLRRARAVALYTPPPRMPPKFARSRFLACSGLFLFHVRPDGSVSRVDVLRSTAHDELDSAVVSAFSRWRFRAGTVSEVRVPVDFAGNYTP